jgi:hypothetical protein
VGLTDVLYNSCQHGSFFLLALQPPWALASSVSFMIIFTEGRTPWTSDQLFAKPLPNHRTTQSQNKHIYTPNIHALIGIRTYDPSLRASTVHALDSSTTVISSANTVESRIYLVEGTSTTKAIHTPFFLLLLLPRCSHTWENRAEFPQFLDQGQSVGLLGRLISSSQSLYLYINTEKRTHIHKH